jgi:putative copper resistance protein D
VPDWAIVAARLLQFGSAVVLFGLPLFCLYGFSAGEANRLSRRWGRMRLGVLIAAAGAFLGVVWWIAAQAAIFFPNAGPFDRDAIGILLTETRFGRVALLRAGLLVLAIIVVLLFAPRRAIWILLSVLGAAVLASFAWTGHGIYDAGWAGIVHMGADILHLFAAGVWIGALVPLSILILQSLRSQTANEARAALYGLERFSGIGPAVVAVLVLTGLVNSWFLVGIAQWQSLFTTAYGIGLTLKLGLFGGMLLLAAANRYRLSPKLRADVERRGSPAASLRKLRVSILTETALSFLVLTAVALLGTWEPPVSAVN